MALTVWTKFLCGVAVIVTYVVSYLQGAPAKLPEGCPTALVYEKEYLQSYRGVCYWFVPYKRRTRLVAEGLCSDNGGKLLEIKTKDVLNFIVNRMDEHFFFEYPVWLNINHLGHIYRWSDMSFVDQSIFPVFDVAVSHQPKCFDFTTHNGGYVMDVACNRYFDTYLSIKNNIICQFDDQKKTTFTSKKKVRKVNKGKKSKSKKWNKSTKPVVPKVKITPQTAFDHTTSVYQTTETRYVTRTIPYEEAGVTAVDRQTTKYAVEVVPYITDSATEENLITQVSTPFIEHTYTKVSERVPVASSTKLLEIISPTTSANDSAKKAVNPSTEATDLPTKAVSLATEAANPTTEAANPSTEAANPTTGAANPTTKIVNPTIKAANPTPSATDIATEKANPVTQQENPTTDTFSTSAPRSTTTPLKEMQTSVRVAKVTTPEPSRKKASKPKCETFTCEKDCMLFGYKRDPVTNCPICDCDFD
ncbi:hypothetical protein RRG08_066318 [Elysia crispata]|uniref:C-type lectin domain-containing protein n=1 Tax=Elysia crispata TaxID=231223 RepID=A0AAE1AU72_9GAST|nr:hypothetical protein RRG08_066318 [Elysia crispata]